MNIFLESLKIIILTYLILVIPQLILFINKTNYTNKKNIYKTAFYSIIYGILFSNIMYFFPKKFFSIFTNINGIINSCTYASKILFMSGSIIGIQIMLLFFFYYKKQIKKTVLLILLKITVLILLILILYSLFHISGLLYAFPLSDLLFFLIELCFFHNIINRKTNKLIVYYIKL